MKRIKEGDVVSVKLANGKFSFGRVLKNPLMAFYDLVSDVPTDAAVVIESPVAFKTWVVNKAMRSGRWPVIGHYPLSDELLKPVTFAKRDPISKAISTYVDGKETRASIDECKGLESAAVWSAEHVEDRLQDYFEGRPNKWVESMRIG
jgi:hypothetical protein